MKLHQLVFFPIARLYGANLNSQRAASTAHACLSHSIISLPLNLSFRSFTLWRALFFPTCHGTKIHGNNFHLNLTTDRGTKHVFSPKALLSPWYCWWFRNPANHYGRYPIIYMGFMFHTCQVVGNGISEPSTVLFSENPSKWSYPKDPGICQERDFFSINSRDPYNGLLYISLWLMK